MENNSKKKLLLIPLLLAVFVVVVVIVSTNGKEWTCDWCGKEWNGEAYYGDDLTDTLCKECAEDYWNPLPIENYVKMDTYNETEVAVRQTEEITTEALIEEYPFTTISDFNEDLACVRCGKDYYYINKAGEAQFLLPKGYDSGEPFYDGFAVIKSGENNYSVVDTSGKVVIDGQKESLTFISRASEGIICAIKKQELYTGTVTSIVFYDYGGKVIATIDNIPFENFGLGYFQFGTVGVAEYDSAWSKTKYHYYGKTGNLVKTLSGLCTLQSDGQYAYSQYPSSLQKGEVFDRKNLKTVSKIERLIDDVAPKNAEYFAHKEYDKKTKTNSFVISDRNGNTEIYKIEGFQWLVEQKARDDNRWVIGLQNDYYAIVDEKANFIFEPIQSTIHYIGESMYFITDTKMVVDKDGKELFLSEYDLRTHSYLFHNGMLKYGDSYIDSHGNMLSTIKIKRDL